MMVQVNPGKTKNQKHDILPEKITKAKRAEGVAQVVECLPSSTRPSVKPPNIPPSPQKGAGYV
jgi:hypothetical protein